VLQGLNHITQRVHRADWSMKTIYDSLARALVERHQAIADHAAREQNPAEHMARLKTVSEKITHLQSQLPADADPRLRHYLERCSYDKALEWLQMQQ
jgi:hypothetical protein